MSSDAAAPAPVLSIVICFRDWGLDRLATAVRAHLRNASAVPLEVVVSDFGSQQPQEVVDVVLPLGARVVRTETSAPWSRSACLNAGVAMARGAFVVTTDADIVFSPGCYREVTRLLAIQPDALYLIQCRDLSKRHCAESIDSLLAADPQSDGWWHELDSSSTIRPRWGMGGFAAFSRTKFVELNGYDERMQIWGGEDNDLATRFRRSGYPLRWLSSETTRIYHIWHEPSQSKANETDEGRCSIQRNRAILAQDLSTVRNLDCAVIDDPLLPTVSVVIPTYRRAGLLRTCLESCRRQSFPNFEVVVVENGDSEEAEPVVSFMRDARFRYVKTVRRGAAVARNIGIERARGRYIVIHDDDDILVSTRISDHLRSMVPGAAGSYGGWIDFDHDSGEVLGCYPGKEFSFAALLCNGKVLTHGCLMLDRKVFRMFRYEEALAAGIDYGFLLMLARNGLRVVHSGAYGILRRMHAQNMTRVNSAEQRTAATRMVGVIKGEIEAADYQNLRKAGLAAQALTCANETEAVAELMTWQAEESVRRRRSFASLREIDSWLEWHGDDELDAFLSSASPAVAALVRSRKAMQCRRRRLTASVRMS